MTKRTSFEYILLISFLMLFLISLAWGGTISGTVKMEGKRDRSGVLITVQGKSLSGISDKEGRYEISDVPPGSYTLTAQKLGYVVGIRSDVVVTTGSVTVDFDLIPGDFNMDNYVNLLDRVLLTKVWKAKKGDANWNDVMDIYEDGIIDEKDRDLLLGSWRKGNPNVKLGSLSVESNPNGASILINGADTGKTTPYTFEGMVVGEYTVTLRLANYTPVEIKAQVKEGQIVVLPTVTLDNQPPEFSNWVKEPANLTEDSKGPLKISLNIVDKGGSGMEGKVPSFDFRIGSGSSYTGFKPMTFVANNVWSFSIPEPVEGWNAYRGQYVYYKIKAEDVSGNVSESLEQQELIDSVNDPPKVEILNVFNQWEKGLITIQADAFDEDGTISSVSFDYSTDKVNWVQIMQPVTKPPYSVAWDTKISLPELVKRIWIRARVSDNEGASAEDLSVSSFSIDNQPPTTSHDYDGLWRNKDFVIKLKSSDGEGIGVGSIFYRLNQGNKQEISVDGQQEALVTISKEDQFNVLEYWATDKLGNEEQHKTLTNIKLDKTPPIFSGWVQEPADINEDSSGKLRIYVQVKDEISGITGKIPQLSYRIGTDLPYSEYKNMATDGKYWYADIPEPQETWNYHRGKYISYKVRCEDVAGNVGESPELVELIDDINDPPSVNILTVFSEWQKGTIELSASATDEDGKVASVQFEYSSDNVNWKPIGPSIIKEPYTTKWDTKASIPQAQLLYLRAKAVDDSGAVTYYTYPDVVGIDNQPPVTSDDYNDLWSKEDFTIKLTANDGAGSGISDSNIRYKINNGDEKNVASHGHPRIVEEGISQLEYWSIDNVGNEEIHRIIQNIKLDKTPPRLIDWAQDPVDLTEDSKGPFRVSVRITDAGSGITGKIPQISYRMGKDTKSTDYVNMTKGETDDIWYYDIPEPASRWNAYRGDHIFYSVRCVDIAGNLALVERQEFIDDINDLPVVRLVTVPTGWLSGVVKLEAGVFDDDGTIKEVVFSYSLNKVNWVQIGKVETSPYSVSWDTRDAIPGVEQTVWLKVVATDDDNGSAEYITPSSFRVDNQPPVTKHNYDGKWHNGDFVIEFSASDDNGAGVAKISYKLNDGEKLEVTADDRTVVPVKISKEGINTLEYWATDRLGNEEVHKTLLDIKLDKTPPIFSSWLLDPADLTEDTKGFLRISVQVSDDISGLLSHPTIDYHIGSNTKFSGYKDMTQSGSLWYFDVPEPSETWDYYRGQRVYYKVKAVDNAGNVTESAEKEELIDSINDPPVVKFITTFKEWEAGKLSVNAEASDPDGSVPNVRFEYSFDKSKWEKIGASPVQSDKLYTVEWNTPEDVPELAKNVWVRAVAIDGDDSSVEVISEPSNRFGVDNEPPVAGDWTRTPADLSEDTTGPFKVSVKFSDGNGIGVKKVELAYRIGNVLSRDFREMKQESDGQWYYDISEPGGWDQYRGQILYYKARGTDALGNVSQPTVEQQELIDSINDPPIGTFVSAFKPWERDVVKIQVEATDEDGQIASVQFQYSTDNKTWIDIGSPITQEPYTVSWNSSSIEMSPEVRIKAIITDNEKASKEVISKQFGVDNKPPDFVNWKLTPADLTESSTDSFLRIEVEVNDQGSGVSEVMLSYKLPKASYTTYQSMYRQGEKTWFLEIPRPIGNWASFVGQSIYYKVKAVDVAGNPVESEERSELIDPTTGSISGNIMPRDCWLGAKVTVQKLGQTVAESSVSQLDGSYSITSLLPGTYSLLISSPGFGTDKSQSNVEVKVGQTTVIPTIELYRYAVEKITRSQGGKIEFKDSTLKIYSLIIEPNTLLRDSTVVLGFGGNEPTNVPNPTVDLLDKAIGIGFEGKDIEKPLRLIIPRPTGTSDPKSVMAFIYNGTDYRVVDRNDIAQSDTTITINIAPQEVKNFSDPNHKLDKHLSRTADTVFYVFITRFEEPIASNSDIGIREPQISAGKIVSYVQPNIATSAQRIALVVHGITSKLEDMLLLINDIKGLKRSDNVTPYYDNVLVFNYNPGIESPGSSASLLSTELARVLSMFKGKIDVIAHCSGGLVARDAIVNLGADERIGSLIMLGTPNGGVNKDLLRSGFANFLKKTQSYPTWSYYRDGWQAILENSQYILNLNNQPGKRVATHYYGISASEGATVNDVENDDGLVFITSSEFSNSIYFPYLEEAVSETIDRVVVALPLTEGLGFMSRTRHLAMLVSAEIREKVLKFLIGKSGNISLVEHDIDLIPGNKVENFRVVLKNTGTDTVYGVRAQLSTTSVYIRNFADQQGLEQDTFNYGDMAKDVTKEGFFKFYVNPNAKNAIGQQIIFTLRVTNSKDNSVNVIQFSAPIGGNLVRIAIDPFTQNKLYSVDVAKDASRPMNDDDSAVELGEVMKITVTLENRSASSMPSVKATLKTDDPRIKGLVGTSEIDMSAVGITADYGTISGSSTSSRTFESIKIAQDPSLIGAQIKFTLDIKSGLDIIGRDEFTIRIGASLIVDEIYVDQRLVPGGTPRDIEVRLRNTTSSELSDIEVRIDAESRYVDFTEDMVRINYLSPGATRSVSFETTVDATFSGYETFTLEIRVGGSTVNLHSFQHYFGMRTIYVADWITSDSETTNSDKIAEPGETIRLKIARKNKTNELAERVKVTIDTNDQAVTRPFLRETVDYDDIGPKSVVEPYGEYKFAIAPADSTVFSSDPDFPMKGRTVQFTLSVEEDGQIVGTETYKMRIGGVIRYLQPAGYSSLIASLSDSKSISSTNNANGKPEPGETIEMTVQLVNITNDITVTDVVATLWTDERDVDVLSNYDEADYGTMQPTGSTKRKSRTFRFTIDENIEVDVIPFELSIRGKINNVITDFGIDEFIIPIER